MEEHYMDNPSCVFHGQVLERLQETLSIIDEKLSDIRIETAGTTAQLKTLNGNVARVTRQVDDHEKWLKNVQSAIDTAKGWGTGARAWIGAIVFLASALAGSITFIITSVFKFK